MTAGIRYVRLRPYEPKTGHVVRVYSHRVGDKFVSFSAAGVWHRVNVALAEELRQIRQDPMESNSQFVFDVCTEEEARALDAKAEAERAAAKARLEPSVDTAIDVTAFPSTGRGDLSLAEVRGERQKALEDAKIRAIGLNPAPTAPAPTATAVVSAEPPAPAPQPEPRAPSANGDLQPLKKRGPGRPRKVF